MASSRGPNLALAIALLGAALALGCRSHPGAPPVEHPTTAADPDAGLPAPPLSRRGVIVPSDVGAGAGPSPGGSDPATRPDNTGPPSP
jgi:hypothetical protein